MQQFQNANLFFIWCSLTFLSFTVFLCTVPISTHSRIPNLLVHPTEDLALCHHPGLRVSLLAILVEEAMAWVGTAIRLNALLLLGRAPSRKMQYSGIYLRNTIECETTGKCKHIVFANALVFVQVKYILSWLGFN